MKNNINYDFLYANGLIACWYLRESQLPLYKLAQNKKRLVCSCRRRFGKTTAIVISMLEKCITTPNLKVYYGSPELIQTRKILFPILDNIYKYAPKQQPKYDTLNGCLVFPNNSKIFLFGAGDSKELDKCRGQEADILILDEFAHFKYRPNYILKEVLLPMLFTTDGQLIISSTPSSDLTHPYFERIRDAKKSGEYFEHTVLDSLKCGDISESQHQQIIKDCGGIESESYQREWLCRVVPPISSLIIPECSQDKEWMINEDQLKQYQNSFNYQYYNHYIAMDIGTIDYTCILFFTYLFESDIFLFEGEIVLKNEEVTTSNIALKIKEKIKSLWKGKPPLNCIADNNNPILLRDLANTEHLYFNPVRKDSLVAMINCARLKFTNKSIKVFTKGSTYLKDCLLFGLWNEKRTDFVRTDTLGHCDGIAALMYGIRSIDTTINPIPFMPKENVFYPNVQTNKINGLKNILEDVLS